MKKTIAVIVGTRPEAIKLAPVIRALGASESLQPFTISTSQHGEMVDQIFNNFGIAADVDLHVMRPRQKLWDLTAILSSELGGFFSDHPMDAVLVQGDTTSALIGGLTAFYHKIPVGHVEAGLRSHHRYSPFPEELNRSLLGRVAQWHFAPTDYAADLLRLENIDNASIYMTGNTVVDALHWMSRHIRHREIRPGILNGQRKLVLVTCHRRENLGLPMRSVALAIKHLADSHPETHFLFPLHPNPGVRELIQPILTRQNGVTLCEPLNYEEFLSALHQSYFVMSDSGGVQEEATALGKPVLVLRRDTERPEGVQAGTLRLVGTDVQEILREAHELLVNPERHGAMSNGSRVFGDGTAARKIQRILEQNLTTANRIVPFKSPTTEMVLME
ncbi:MAG: non-hydrolyzing UDP-N-acetylglucosamine 2-epimerase [Terrimicrobiaceae bacterium]